jgi:hypothetical protein
LAGRCDQFAQSLVVQLLAGAQLHMPHALALTLTLDQAIKLCIGAGD